MWKIGSYMATVDGLRGVMATGETIEACWEDLIEVMEIMPKSFFDTYPVVLNEKLYEYNENVRPFLIL
jgi:predicted RNase H-like HicB family nuclease